MSFPTDMAGTMFPCPRCERDVLLGPAKERLHQGIGQLRQSSNYKTFRRACQLLAWALAIAAFVNATVLTKLIFHGKDSDAFEFISVLLWFLFLGVGLSFAYIVQEGGNMLADMADDSRNRTKFVPNL